MKRAYIHHDQNHEDTNSELIKARFIIDQFIYRCSHDLKSPLSSIQGLVNITEHYHKDDEVKECLDMIKNCALTMKDMIRTMEEFMISAQRDLDKKEINAHVLVGRILNELSGEIKEKGVVIVNDISHVSGWKADEHFVYLILKNLIQNAIHFSDPNKINKKIRIRITPSRGVVSVEVKDNGVGIPEQEQVNLFKMFHRCSSMSKGHGLGLFLVKTLIQKLNASYLLSSKEGVGTTFQLSIPHC